MNNYCVELSVQAARFLDKLDQHLQDRIKVRLKRLESNPIPSDSKFITKEDGESIFRYRIGDYRALYKVKNKEKTVLIAKIDKRPRVYQ